MTSSKPRPRQDEDMIRNFLDAMVAMRGISPNTVAAYERDLFAACDAMPSSRPLTNANADDLRHFLKIWAKDLAPRSVARRLSALRSFMGFLIEENIRKDDPSAHIDLPKIGKSLPKSLSEDDMAKLLKTAADDNTPNGIMLMSILEMLYGTGLRISELVQLPVGLFTRRNDHITVMGKGKKERIVMLTEAAHNAVQAWIKCRDADGDAIASSYLYPSGKTDRPISRERVYMMLRDLGIRAGLRVAISPHMLRHSFATHMLNRGADLRSLQLLLGHADISTTEIYTHTRDDRLAGLVNDTHPLARFPKIDV